MIFNLASGQRPDVILLDINLVGESGTDVARRLADEGGHPRISIIVVSGTVPVEVDGGIG